MRTPLLLRQASAKASGSQYIPRGGVLSLETPAGDGRGGMEGVEGRGEERALVATHFLAFGTKPVYDCTYAFRRAAGGKEREGHSQVSRHPSSARRTKTTKKDCDTLSSAILF